MIGADKVITCYIEQKDETYKKYLIEGVTWREVTDARGPLRPADRPLRPRPDQGRRRHVLPWCSFPA